MSAHTSILQNATPAQLEQAAAENHTQLFALNAIARGGEVISADGLTYTCGGQGKEAMVAFPVLNSAGSAEQLDVMMAYYREHAPKGIGCWSLYPPQPADLGIQLLARGFQPGWQPNWMALDVQAIQARHAIPAGLQVKADNDTVISDIKNLPYAGDNGAVSDALMKTYPERAQRFIATLSGKVVGHSCVFLSTGDSAVAGLYNVGVLPRYRQQGIGKAVVSAACLYAKEQGYRYVLLNGTGRRMYEQVGFQKLGDGLTWWMNTDTYRTDPPAPYQVTLSEAVGRGDLAALNGWRKQFPAYDLSKPITNGMTLVQLAAHCRQPRAAEWLAEQGVAYSVLDAWDLGWKDRAAALLVVHPEQANHLHGPFKITLLHIAAERNDIALAQLALTAHPDLEIKDTIYDGTPLGWAQHIGRPAIAKLIEEYMRNAQR